MIGKLRFGPEFNEKEKREYLLKKFEKANKEGKVKLAKSVKEIGEEKVVDKQKEFLDQLTGLVKELRELVSLMKVMYFGKYEIKDGNITISGRISTGPEVNVEVDPHADS